MENYSYSNAFNTIGIGMKELIICLWNSFKKNSREITIGALHHWLFSLLLIALFSYSIMQTINARLERDTASHQEFILQQQNDSMKCILESRK